MAAYSARRTGPSGPVLRSISPSPKLNRQTTSFHSSSSFASATSSAFSTAARTIQRPSSPNHTTSFHSSSLSFSVDRPGSPNRSISVSNRVNKPPPSSAGPKRTCMCSPTNHPGSFRCSLHKSVTSSTSQTVSCGSSSRLNMRRSAMKNSLVRMVTVEGDLVKRALAALIRPSSHHQRRRGEFRPCPSRLSVMRKA